MDRRIIHYLSIGLLLFFSSISIVRAQEVDNSILWEISGNGLEKPSYLFGIINFIPENEFAISGRILRAMDECDLFITKIPHTKASQKEFTKAARIANDGWINDYLTDDELNQLRLLMLKDLEVTEHDYHFTYSRLQPVILVTASTLLYLGEDVVFVEDELAKAAKKHHLKFRSLSTIEEEIAAFEKFPIPDQVEALKYTVNNWEEHINDYDKLVQSYVGDQDLEMIHEEILRATNRSEIFQEAYYYSRNKSWTGQIKELIAKDAAFISVGAGHFYGKEGLIQLLKKEGYSLNPVDAF